MMNIFSKVDPSVILCSIMRESEQSDVERVDFTPTTEFIQSARVKMKNKLGKTWKPHKHLPLDRHTTKTHEAWIVIRGKSGVTVYDIDDTFLCEEVLGPGDCAVMYNGGHTYTILDDDCLIYEFKSGPYLGAEKDKQCI